MKSKHFVLLMASLICMVISLPAKSEESVPVSLHTIECPDAPYIRYVPNKSTPYRIITDKSETQYSAYFELPKGSVAGEVTEVARSSKFNTGLQIIRRIIGKLAGVAEIKATKEKTCIKYTSVFDRSTITIKAKSENGTELGSALYIKGPEEHGWISADVVVSGLKQLTLDQNNNVVEKSIPGSFYAGFNYRFGDVYEEDTGDWKKNLSAKLLVHISTTPTDSYGIGLGYSNFTMWGLLPPFDIFAARMLTQNDASLGVSPGSDYSTVVGISFDISKALDWVK